MTKSKKGTLYLFPVTLGNNESIAQVIPAYNHEILHRIRVFIVENVRNARRFIKKTGHPLPIDEMQFFELNKHTAVETVDSFLHPAENGEDIGVLSDAGTPAVADPGAVVVNLAHRRNIRVVPLVGPNSIGAYGFRIQRTAVLFSWLFAHWEKSTCKKDSRAGAGSLAQRCQPAVYRNALPE